MSSGEELVRKTVTYIKGGIQTFRESEIIVYPADDVDFERRVNEICKKRNEEIGALIKEKMEKEWVPLQRELDMAMRIEKRQQRLWDAIKTMIRELHW